MDTDDTGYRQRIPISIHFIALFYVIQAVIILGVFYDTRKIVSSALITVDIVTLLLLLIPLVALWSIYKPNRYLRWFPLYGIALNWVVVTGIGYYMLQITWLREAMGPGEDTGVVDGMFTLAFLVIVTLWMLIALLLLYTFPSAWEYFTQDRHEIGKNATVMNNRRPWVSIVLTAVLLFLIASIIYALIPNSNFYPCRPQKMHLSMSLYGNAMMAN